MSDPFDYTTIQEYLASLVPPRPDVLRDMEAYAAAHDFPIIGPVVGQFCYQVARLMGARSVFELGSGFGYSTAWFARAVQENGGGVVHHTVWDDALSHQAQEYLSRLGYTSLVHFHNAEAVQTLRETPGLFDIIFNDIDKEAYPDSLPLIKEKLRPGGVLIIDNMLWHARIFDPADHTPATEGVRRFTQAITTDPDWVVSLLPLRDGVILAYKKGEAA
ncbi:MAG: O-methyltransferase [Anaerolineales bacterium]|nr:O-methyltransferase [Anaerolineales bacterium]MCX7756342.1 O-methyltransferase [Anaerolineales bacterium]MDW8276676.1 O-methyltransferase [Anaerolineales bacterium]